MASFIGFVIDPRFQINYSSYYLQGMADLVGWKNVTFDVEPFMDEISVTSRADFMKGMAFLVRMSDGMEKRVFLDSFDSAQIHEQYYCWCDVYAKVNVKAADVSRDKLIAIGPGFGIRIWNPLKSLLIGVRNYCKARKAAGYLPSLSAYLSNYAYTFVRRCSYSAYEVVPASAVNKDYVFSLHTLWYDDLTYSSTNHFRAVFFRCCQKVYKKVEGGFFYIHSDKVVQAFPKYKDYLQEYGDMLCDRRMSMKRYLQKTRRSHIVFNTPSVEGCLGWKLAEYLAMGKVIISMPLDHVMPGEFEKGVHYLQIDRVEDMDTAIRTLRSNEKLYRRMSSAASLYFDEFLAPRKVIERIMEYGNV